MEGDRRPAKPRTGFLDTLKAIAWAFFGVRKGRSHEQDMSRLNPVHVIVVALLVAVVFVSTLVTIARWAAS